MTATDELRRMLDERGVEYRFSECTKVFDWHFNGANGEGDACAMEVQGGINILARGITPEQAIAATLGAGTCTLINAADDLGSGTSSFMCFECGYTALDDWWEEFNFCPNCGRRVINE